MWHSVAAFIIKFRIALLVMLLAATAFMGYWGSQVQLSYQYADAIPRDNPKYKEYQAFRQKFGEDGNTMVIGVQTKDFFSPGFFQKYAALVTELEKAEAVDNILSVPGAINIIKDTANGKLKTEKLAVTIGVENADSFRKTFENLPFYKGLLYNAETGAYMMALSINKEVINSKRRQVVIRNIVEIADKFSKDNKIEMHYSGLPYIRASVMTMIKSEMRLFLILSFALTAVILMIFFRSFMAVLTSMVMVAIGVVWTMGTIVLLGYEITMLTGLLPSLIVVIGIPNCIYFLNKYHSEYQKNPNKTKALLRMVDSMGIVTLFTNMTAAIGFGVFAFTQSNLLRTFGIVAAIDIVALFVISIIFIPALYSFLPPPKGRHTHYLQSKWINGLLTSVNKWVFSHRPWIYAFTGLVMAVSLLGMYQLRTIGYIVDDLPEDEKVYVDLKFFEKHFTGVMPLEIVIDTRKKNAATSLTTMQKIEELNNEIKGFPEMGRVLSYVEGVKFARQAYYNGDSSSYGVPNMFDGAFIQPYLRGNTDKKSMFGKIVNSFMDSTRQIARLSINIADVGTNRLPVLLDSLKPKALAIFDTSAYDVTFTGTSVVFLEGSRFIINSLGESIILAFIMIFGCMIFLFRSWRVLLISIVINIVPLVITAGIMGWSGIVLKPSTVLVFSIALGITVDVTIRFLVNFRQELARNNNNISAAVHKTIHDTGLSIIYTSLILIVGFGVFILSRFEGTQSLGLLTSLTLFIAMVTNLVLQPALLLWMDKVMRKTAKPPGWLIGDDEKEKEDPKS